MSDKIFGIDLGTNNIKIYQKGKGIAVHEKNVLAIQRKKDVFAFGDAAYEMYEKSPEYIQVEFPMRHGVIAQFSQMQTLLHLFLSKKELKNHGMGKRQYYIAVPNDITEVEKRAFHDLIASSNIRAKDIKSVEKPIADAVGAGLDVLKAQGLMVINIGAETTEISILSLGGIVLSKLLHVGGNHLDESICLQVKKQHNLIIGKKTANLLKVNLAAATEEEARSGVLQHVKTEQEPAANTENTPEEEDSGLEGTTTMAPVPELKEIRLRSKKILGRDLITGLPLEAEISSQLIYDAIVEFLHTIVDAAKVILERTPPELSSDIIHNGIYVTGGSAKICKLDELMAMETGLDINIADEPETCVVRGLGKIMEDQHLKQLAFPIPQ